MRLEYSVVMTAPQRMPELARTTIQVPVRVAEHVEPGGIVGAGMVHGHNTVALAMASDPLGTLALVSW